MRLPIAIGRLLLSNKNAVYYSSRGSAYYQLKSYRAALLDQNTAIGLDRNLPQAYYYRGLIKTAIGEKQSAISRFPSGG